MRREDLRDDDSVSSSASSNGNQTLSLFNETSLDFIEQAPTSSEALATQDDKGEDEAFAFRLFASKPAKTSSDQTATANVPRIRLDSPSQGNGGLIAPRPLSHYVWQPLSESARASLASLVVDGDQVLAAAKKPSPSLTQPWRVAHVSASGKPSLTSWRGGRVSFVVGETLRRQIRASSINSEDVGEESRRKRGRAGKKQRIKRRVAARRMEAQTRKKEAELQQQREKEEHMRDKKRALNRKKQHKKREKNRAAAESTNGDGDGDE